MKKLAVVLGVALAAGTGLVAVRAQSEEAKAAAAAIQKQADDTSKKSWDELSATGKELARKHELLDVMNLLKLRKTDAKVSGLGVGVKPGAISPDGIEAKIISLTKRPLDAAKLSKESADIARMADITAAVASVTIHQCPIEKKMGPKDPADWKKWMEEMYKGAQDLSKAARAKDAAAIKTAANRLDTSCKDCHAVFRD